MKTPRTRIAKLIAKRTLNQGISKSYAKEIAAYLLTERRTRELDSLLRDVGADWARAGHVEVIATSTHPLDAHVKTEISVQTKELYPEAKDIIITETHDPKMIGGVRLNLPNRQLDLTVRAKLNKFKQLTIGGKA
jgi:F0F1-type ATP synthase delta subunit